MSRSVRRILIINGNPARQRDSFSAVLCRTYEEAATAAGFAARVLRIAELEFDPILHEGYHGDQPPEPDIAKAREDILWASHIVVIYPMWQFNVPALLKGFCERTLTADFAYATNAKSPLKAALLKGRSVHLIQTMAMPAVAYGLMFGRHGAMAFRSLFGFCGFKPVRLTCLGMIEDAIARKNHLVRVRQMAAQGL